MKLDEIRYRLMTLADITRVPIGCQGDASALAARIREVGSSAVLAFDGEQHVAQLQFRPFCRALRSPNGLWDPRYWGDFGDDAPDLPSKMLSIFCYHVGQLEDTEDRDARYQGQGIGLEMLDFLLRWARTRGFAGIIAKASPSHRAVMSFMGGQSVESYRERGFEVIKSWVDDELREVIHKRSIVTLEVDSDHAACVSCCVKRF
ncbi:MAG: GNAT family N-acetyltransferase [Gammaproteobacteria bacterium]